MVIKMQDWTHFSNPWPFADPVPGKHVRVLMPEGRHAHGYVESIEGDKATVVLDNGEHVSAHKTNVRVENPKHNFMPVTGQNRREWRRAARALRDTRGTDYGAGARALQAGVLEKAASSGFLTTAEYDRAAEAYRNWLVFNEPKG